MQHQPLELRHLVARDPILGTEMRKVAEHPAQRVAQLAIDLGEVLQDLRSEADVVGVVRRAHPHAQNVGAVRAHHVLRRDDVALRLRHLVLALFVEDEAVGQHHVERRDAARPAGLEQ